jgi:hypothetical protein
VLTGQSGGPATGMPDGHRGSAERPTGFSKSGTVCAGGVYAALAGLGV